MSIINILYEKKYGPTTVQITRVGMITPWDSPESIKRMERYELMLKLNDALHNYKWQRHGFTDIMKICKGKTRDELLGIWEEWKKKTPEQIYNFLFCSQIELFEGVAQ